jgi:SGNH domain (fused to AT3 domains)
MRQLSITPYTRPVTKTIKRLFRRRPLRTRAGAFAFAGVVPAALISLFVTGVVGGAINPTGAAAPWQLPWQDVLGPSYPGAAVLGDHLTGHLATAPVAPSLTKVTLPQYWAQGCLPAQTSPKPKECVYGDTKNPALTVALVGDSMAGNFFTPLDQIAIERHWKLVVDMHSTCPWTSTMLIQLKVGGDYTACHAWGESLLHDLVTTIKPNVVITSDYPYFATTADPKIGQRAETAIGEGMIPYWTQLEDHGISVIALRETPFIGITVPSCLTRNHGVTAKCAVPAKKAILADPPTEIAAHALNGEVPDINLNPLICPGTTCEPIIGNVLVYQDSHHLTSLYSSTLTPFLEQDLLTVSKALRQA